MRRLLTGERIAMGVGVAFLTAPLYGCDAGGAETGPTTPGTRAEASPGAETPAPTLRAIGAVVIHGIDGAGRSVGVQSYESPWDGTVDKHYNDSASLSVFCMTPGRRVVDDDVPQGSPPTVSTKWYLLNTPYRDWMGDGYVQPDSAVPACPPELVPPSPGQSAQGGMPEPLYSK